MVRPIQILKELIETTAHTITIDSVVTDSPLVYTIETCNTYYLNVGKTIEIDSISYTITALTLNTSITITGSVVPTATSFEIDPPLFIHGTPKDVQIEFDKYDDGEKFPFIWLVEYQNTDYDNTPTARIKLTADFNLLFLDCVNKQDWTISDHYENVIDTQLNEVNYFIRILKRRKDLFETEDFTHSTTNHVNFGDYIVNRGYDRKILNDDVSGVQCSLKLPYITSGCDDGCSETIVSICQPSIIEVNGVFEQFLDGGETYNCVTSGSVSLDIDVNGTSFYVGVSTDQDLPVKNVALINVGSKIGANWIIGNTGVSVKNTIDDVLISANLYSETSGNELVVGDSNISNSDDTFSVDVPAEVAYELADQSIEVFVDSVSQGVTTYPAMTNPTINIIWT